MKTFLLILIVLTSSPILSAASSYTREQIVFGDVLAKIQIETSLNKQEAFKIMQKSFALIKQNNHTFSPFLSSSELSNLNAAVKPIRHYKISNNMHSVLRIGKWLHELTHGFFDMTYEMSRNANAEIHLHADSISLLKPDIQINPTGIVKGFTVDAIIKLLKKYPAITDMIVTLGGDIRHYNKQHKPTRVFLANPQPANKKSVNQPLYSIDLYNQAVSTSGFYARGRHIKNTTHSQTEHAQVSVIADSCTLSDGLATAMMYMPEVRIRQLALQYSSIRIIVIKANGRRLEI